MRKRKTKEVKIGNLVIGGNNPVTIQSMTNTDTRDYNKTIRQILELQNEDCDIVRAAVPDVEAAEAIKKIKPYIDIPLVADIHFDYRLAIRSVENGIDALRINPGNIGNEIKIKEVVSCAKHYNIPIRIGVNSGSVEKDLLEKYKGPTPEAMVESVLRNVNILEKYDFNEIVLSVKSSNVIDNIKSYKLLAEKTEYPLHLGVTEAGTSFSGTIKSSIGIGTLLVDGIGDTIRVSLTDNPIQEIKVAKEILKACNLRNSGIEIISCPTCGRTQIDLISIAREAEKKLSYVNKPIKIAIMGCAVNGPGEAREADLGIAGGHGEGLIFKKGKVIRKVPEKDLLTELIKEIEKI